MQICFIAILYLRCEIEIMFLVIPSKVANLLAEARAISVSHPYIIQEKKKKDDQPSLEQNYLKSGYKFISLPSSHIFCQATNS
jgi:hypothetical protein